MPVFIEAGKTFSFFDIHLKLDELMIKFYKFLCEKYNYHLIYYVQSIQRLKKYQHALTKLDSTVTIYNVYKVYIIYWEMFIYGYKLLQY